jgi:Cys-rich four helix bundle protein (predicted Tat secretion target)
MPDRRDVLLAGAALAMSASGIARTAEAAEATLVDELGRCAETGNVCLQHCLAHLGKGETALAECAVAVRDMLAVCNAVGVLAAAESRYLKASARLCLDVCEGCENACRPHRDHHPECRACGDACAAVIAKLRPLLA